MWAQLKSNHQSLYSLNKNQNQSKTVAKAKKTSAKQMEQAGDCISQQCSAVLNLQLISRFLAFFDKVRVKDVRTKPTEVAQNPSKIEKTLRMLLKLLVSFKFLQDEKHGNDCKNYRIKTHQKPWQKPWKLQQNKWKKAGDCISQQCSAMLTLQLMPTFLEFLQG